MRDGLSEKMGTFSWSLRRTHMYLALFFFPWMLMYALSTVAMNHRAWFAGPPAAFEKERELVYDGVVPEEVTPRIMAQQILASIGLDGTHTVTRRDDGRLVIDRNDLVTPRRITYTPGDRGIIIERMPLRTNAWLERFHRRRGYGTGYALDTAWAVSVDLVIVAMLFWALSGLWMWWEMRVTRKAGLLAAVGGAGLFAFNVYAYSFWQSTQVKYFTDRKVLTAEDRRFRWDEFLTGMHARGEFEQAGILPTSWSVVVDLVQVGILAWIASGLWMWWELRGHRRWGVVAILGGTLSFVWFTMRL